jgi:hypothetical protein
VGTPTRKDRRREFSQAPAEPPEPSGRSVVTRLDELDAVPRGCGDVARGDFVDVVGHVLDLDVGERGDAGSPQSPGRDGLCFFGRRRTRWVATRTCTDELVELIRTVGFDELSVDSVLDGGYAIGKARRLGGGSRVDPALKDGDLLV